MTRKIRELIFKTGPMLKALLTVDQSNVKPGFIGKIPYLVLLRWLIFIGVFLRFMLHKDDYTFNRWVMILASICIAMVFALAATYVTYSIHNFSKRLQVFFITLDIILISGFYCFTGNTQSDFFLFYYLPIFEAAEYLSGTSIVIVFLSCTFAFGTVLMSLLPVDPDKTLNVSRLFLRVFLPREVFFFSITALWSYLHQIDQRQKAELSNKEEERRILHDELQQTLGRRNKEIAALHAGNEAILSAVQAVEYQQVLESILDKCIEVVTAPVAYIAYFKWWKEVFELGACRGVPEEKRKLIWKLGEGIVGKAADKKEIIFVPNVNEGEWRQDNNNMLIENTGCKLAIPLIYYDRPLAVLCVEHPEICALGEEEKTSLKTLAIQATIALRAFDLSKKLERQIKPMHYLNRVATRIQDPRYDLDTKLRLLLTGVTSGVGAGFSRAMLFLMDEKRTKLQGKMAIGARTAEEASSIWKSLDEQARELRASGKEVLKEVLDQVENFSAAVTEKGESDWPLSMAVKNICIPSDKVSGALSVCISDKNPIIVRDNQHDFFREIIEQVSQPGDLGHAFICVPLVSEKEVVGIMVADNRFLVSERDIEQGYTEGYTSILQTFAGMITISIEYSKLQAHLVDQHKLATWKESAARAAHVITSRINVIEGEATKLRDVFGMDDSIIGTKLGDGRIYLSKLWKGISDAYETLKEFRLFGSKVPLKLEQINLIQILKEAIQEIQPIVDYVTLNSYETEINLRGDARKLSESFYQLIKNAHESMGHDTIETTKGRQIIISVKIENLPPQDIRVAKIEIEDNGPGIPQSEKRLIFEPLLGGSKPMGSGLGLAIVKETIEKHKGAIEEIGVLGEGALFVIYLPLNL